MDDRFTAREVVRLTGITPRQLQWWDERGIVVPRRQGRRRIYDFEDLAEVAVISALRRKGFSLQRIRRVVDFLEREFSKRLAETVSGGSDYHLLSDGSSLYLETSPDAIVDILKNSRQPIFAVCLSDTVREVRALVSGRKPPAGSTAPRAGARARAKRSS
jgi:DNA-binding transcriptional MerR regulator